MEEIIPLYGKTFHFWQVDRGDTVPLGMPQLMGSFVDEDMVKRTFPSLDKMIEDRDQRFHLDHKTKAKAREYIENPKKHPGKFKCSDMHMLLGVIVRLTRLQMLMDFGRTTRTKRQNRW